MSNLFCEKTVKLFFHVHYKLRLPFSGFSILKGNQILYLGKFVKTVILDHHMILLLSRFFSTTYKVSFQCLFLLIFTHWNKSISINIWMKIF